ncbi:MAG: hypothetical protein RLZZ74_950 [Cyanobacteriota bacterium]|jgi:hypothetical protein
MSPVNARELVLTMNPELVAEVDRYSQSLI